MADIELVIKIPEEDYKHILHRQKEYCITTSELEDVIANGTPLIDESKITYKKEWFNDTRKEIEKLAKFHSIEVPVVYGDGEETTDKMVSLEELGRILSEIEDAIDAPTIIEKDHKKRG